MSAKTLRALFVSMFTSIGLVCAGAVGVGLWFHEGNLVWVMAGPMIAAFYAALAFAYTVPD